MSSFQLSSFQLLSFQESSSQLEVVVLLLLDVEGEGGEGDGALGFGAGFGAGFGFGLGAETFLGFDDDDELPPPEEEAAEEVCVYPSWYDVPVLELYPSFPHCSNIRLLSLLPRMLMARDEDEVVEGRATATRKIEARSCFILILLTLIFVARDNDV